MRKDEEEVKREDVRNEEMKGKRGAGRNGAMFLCHKIQILVDSMHFLHSPKMGINYAVIIIPITKSSKTLFSFLPFLLQSLP